MNAIRQFLDRKYPHFDIVTLCVSFLVVMVYLTVRNVTIFHHDGLMYWTVADPVFKDGLHLTNFPESFRGYLLPVLLGVIRFVGYSLLAAGRGEYLLFRMATAAVISLFFSIILPVLFGKKVVSVRDGVRIVAVTLVALFFWGDFFSYPMSDFAPVFFISAGIVLIKTNLGSEKNRIVLLLEGVLAGMSLYAAYNIRVAYLYACILTLVYIAIAFKQGKRIRPSFVLGLAIGCAVVALPQSLINHKYTNSYVPKVHTEQLFGYKTSLEKQQVLWGLSWDDVLGYVGPEEEHPVGGVLFDDKAGVTMLLREGLFTVDNFTYVKFFKLFIKYPLDMISVYVRHFVLLMTPKYAELFITDMYPNKGMRVSLIIVLWFAAFCTLLHSLQNKKFNFELVGLVFIIFLPSLLQLLGAPEIRFFVGVHMIGYFYTVYYVDYSQYGALLKKYALPILACFVVFSFLWIGVLSSLLSSNKGRVLLINDRNVYRPATVAPAE